MALWTLIPPLLLHNSLCFGGVHLIRGTWDAIYASLWGVWQKESASFGQWTTWSWFRSDLRGIRDPQKQWLSRRSLKCYFRPQITTRQHDSKRSPDGRLLHCFFVFFEHAVAVLAKAVGRDFAGTVVRTGKSGRNIYAERWLLVAGFHWPVVCGRTHCGGRLFPPRCFFLCLNRISSGIETRPTLYKLGLTSDFLQQWCPICRLSFVRSALSVSLTSPEFQQFNNNVQFEFRPAITCKFA
jgi:hypothetical protein